MFDEFSESDFAEESLEDEDEKRAENFLDFDNNQFDENKL